MSLKERVRSMNHKTKSHWIAFWICLGTSIFLMIGSAIVPPPFVIDQSIFKAVAYLLGFAALGQVPVIVESGKSAKLKHGNTSLTVGDFGEDEESINNKNDFISNG